MEHPVEFQCLLRRQLGPHDHVAYVDRVWQHRVIIQFFEGGFRIVVVHTLMISLADHRHETDGKADFALERAIRALFEQHQVLQNAALWRDQLSAHLQLIH